MDGKKIEDAFVDLTFEVLRKLLFLQDVWRGCVAAYPKGGLEAVEAFTRNRLYALNHGVEGLQKFGVIDPTIQTARITDDLQAIIVNLCRLGMFDDVEREVFDKLAMYKVPPGIIEAIETAFHGERSKVS
jgi:hypothetical protein